MADNITLNAGSGGSTLATDDDGTAHHQYVKVEFGADNTQTPVDSSNPLPIELFDAGGASVIKDEDATHSSGDPGIMALAVRNDTLAALAGTDGDYAPLQVNASGALFVQEGSALDVSAATVTVDLGANNDVTIDNSSIVKAEDAVHSSGDAGVMSLAVRNDTLAALAGTDGDYAPLQVNASGALFVQEGSALDVSAATVTVDLGANNDVTIDNSSIVHAEDAVHGSGDAGIMPLAVRNDTLAALAGTDGDYAPLQVNGSGALFVQEGSALDVSAATVTVDLGANNDVTIDNSSIVKAEDAVHGSGDSGVMSLAVRNDALAALAGTDGDYAPLQVSALGGVYSVLAPETTGGLSIYYDNDLDETAVAVKAGAGQVYGIYAINTTAAPLYLQLFNVAQGSVTVGTTTPTVQFVIPANADSDGAGFWISLPHGVAFGTAITAAASTNSEGNGAPGANAAHVNIFYK